MEKFQFKKFKTQQKNPGFSIIYRFLCFFVFGQQQQQQRRRNERNSRKKKWKKKEK